MAKSLEGNLIKRAHAPQRYTLQEVTHLEACMDPVDGPLYFCKNFLMIQHPVRGSIKFEPYEYQERLIRSYHNYKQSIGMLPRQMGKALSNVTPILTPAGFVAMGELQTGDYVYGPDGKPTRVTFITETMHDRSCYEVEFTHGEKIVADADHLWTWHSSILDATVTGTTEELRCSHLSDGNIYIDHTYTLLFEPTSLIIDLLLPELLNSDNFNSYIFNDVGTRINLLHDIVATMGTINDVGICTFLQLPSQVATNIRLLLSTLGIVSECTKFDNNRTLIFDSTNIELISTSPATMRSNNRIYIRSIRPTASVPVRCLQVDNHSNLFLAGDTLIPTHNTTCATGYLLWYTMFMPESQVLIAAHKYEGAQDIMNRYRFGYENLPDFIRAGVYSYNRNTIEYDNGSRIQAVTTTENTGRGKSLSLIYCDEFSYVQPPEKAREFWTALSPTLSTGGKCIITSTPNSDEDQFAQIWSEANKKFDEFGNEQELGANGFHSFFAHWNEHPERDEQWAEEQRSKIGLDRFRREFDCVSANTSITLQDEDGNIFVTTMGEFYDQCAIMVNQTLKPNTKNYRVLTPSGFRPFAGISMRGIKPLIRLEFEKGAWIECTFNHKLYVGPDLFRTAEELQPGDVVECVGGSVKLISKTDLEKSEPVYDLIEVGGGHRYYTNDILSSNCEFLIFDETLINAVKLSDFKGTEPIMTMGQTRWYKDIDPRAIYLVSLDPSLGTGGDYAAIQVFEMPNMEQVAEWRHNLTPIQAQIRNLREITKYITERGIEKGGVPQIYYSVENNTLGEAALVVITDIGEDQINGLFLSEPLRKGHIRKFRKGFNTTHRTKITACSRLKNLLETNKMIVNSKPLISELKTFVAHGIGFGAKSGEHDDLVSSTLLIIRMAAVLADWDPRIYEKMSEKITEEQMPMPIFVTRNF